MSLVCSDDGIEPVFSSETVPRGQNARCGIDERAGRGIELSGHLSSSRQRAFSRCNRRVAPIHVKKDLSVVMIEATMVWHMCQYIHHRDGD